jgi:acyl-CoA synthetase (NDP forming)/GNAT superfamily N-acetyltransferase
VTTRDVVQVPAVDALTADGAIVRIRTVTAEDTGAIEALFRRGSTTSLHLRFFSTPTPRQLAAEVQRLTRPLSPVHATIAAELAGDLVGVASYERRGPEEPEAEFAVFVDDRHQGRGIGTLLLEHLSRFARAHGIRRLYGEVLAANSRMLRVADGLAATTTSRIGDGVVEVSVATTVDEAAIADVDARDRTAERASLRPLLAPRSVAVVGAGRRPGGVGHEVLRAIIGYGFAGPVYAVNPHTDHIQLTLPPSSRDGDAPGETRRVPSYPSLADLPGPAELAVIAVPADQVAGVLADAAAAGTRGAVILSAGFSEAGEEGRIRQAEVLRLARSAGIRLVGPNCLGIINTDPEVRLDASFAPQPPRPGGLAVASQSGAVGIAVLDHTSRSGCGVSSFVSLGNKADVSGNDLLAYWYDDPATTAVALYLESFGNPRKFARVARALARRNPVLAVFSGRTAAGRRAGASHTAAAAAPGVAVDTLFAQAGVVRADHLGELVDAARMLTDQPLPAGNRLAVVGNAGGANVLVADAAEANGLQLPATVAGRDNPLDLGAGATPEALREALTAIAASGDADVVLVIVAATRTNDPVAMREHVGAIADAHPFLPMALVELGREHVTAVGARRVPAYELPERAVRAISHAVRYATWRREPLGSRPDLPDLDPDGAREVVRTALAEHPGWQPYRTIRDILERYRLPLVASRQVDDPDAAVEAAGEIGYPVVVKAADPELIHKSDLGLVRLGLTGADAVRDAYRAIAATLRQARPPVLVQPMASGTVELVAGIVHDPLFGSLVMTGLGGIHTDLLGDRAFRLVPLTDLDAGRMWRSLRSAPLLTGYRGSPPVDTAAVEDLLLRLGRLAEDLPEVAELDLNPVLAGPDGVVVVDAKLRLAPTGPEPDPYLRRLR